MALTNLGFITIIILSIIYGVNAFSSNTFPAPTANRMISSSTTSLQMVFGPKQALAIEKRKNPQAFESTIQGLMKTKGLSRADAEKRYGEFLLDPDGFALRAAEAERREAGYKDWIEQAVAKSDDPEGTRKRIEDFTRTNRIKGTAIMIVGSAALLAYASSNPYVPPGH